MVRFDFRIVPASSRFCVFARDLQIALYLVMLPHGFELVTTLLVLGIATYFWYRNTEAWKAAVHAWSCNDEVLFHVSHAPVCSTGVC